MYSCQWQATLFVCLFVWLHRVLVVACRIFSCGMWTLSCGMWDLVPWPGIKPGPPALGAWSLSHWTTREVPAFFLLNLPLCHLVCCLLHQCHVISPMMPVKPITLWINHLPAVESTISLLVFQANSIGNREFYKLWWIYFSWTFRLLLIKMFVIPHFLGWWMQV